MPAMIDTRKVQGVSATELYISAVPSASVTSQGQMEELFSQVADVLRKENANIIHEWIYTVDDASAQLSAARQKAYGKLDDGVAPSLLIGRTGRHGLISGVQVHAVAASNKPSPVMLDGKACGRLLKSPALTYLTLSGITAGQSGAHAKLAREMLEKGESVLKQFGGDFTCVPRTWMWLGDILSWYDEFNNARNRFFTERGLIGKNTRRSMPASTGIGLMLGAKGQFGMDLTAVIEPKNSIEFSGAIGRQQCALDYGSAFSRASRAAGPAGKTVFVSGTASIDTAGATTHIGDARAQIESTLKNVRAVLCDMNCSDSDVVYAVAYCKTPEVENIFDEFRTRFDWPWVAAVCDICRDNLLFEVEAAAILRR